MLQSHETEKTVVADWWSYDAEDAMLYYETKEDGKTPVFKKTHTYFFAESKIGDGWIVASEEDEENTSIVLWNSSELNVGNDLVAEVVKWELSANSKEYTFGINTAVVTGKQPWVWEEGFPIVTLRGYYRDGGYFEDPIRLIIPLENNGMIAIGKSRGRHYYLHTATAAATA